MNPRPWVGLPFFYALNCTLTRTLSPVDLRLVFCLLLCLIPSGRLPPVFLAIRLTDGGTLARKEPIIDCSHKCQKTAPSSFRLLLVANTHPKWTQTDRLSGRATVSATEQLSVSPSFFGGNSQFALVRARLPKMVKSRWPICQNARRAGSETVSALSPRFTISVHRKLSSRSAHTSGSLGQPIGVSVASFLLPATEPYRSRFLLRLVERKEGMHLDG